MSNRAANRAGMEHEVHLRLIDSDLDSIDAGLKELAVEVRAGLKELGDRQTRNLIVAAGAIMAFAGSIVTAVVV